MVGNSLNLDALPILALGGTANHIPYHVTASFERHDDEISDAIFYQLTRFAELPVFSACKWPALSLAL